MNLLGPNWIPKVGGIVYLIGVGIKKAPSPSVSSWSDMVESIGVGLLAWYARQHNVTSEESGAKTADPAAEAVARKVTQ
jgi:hypothetical protein